MKHFYLKSLFAGLFLFAASSSFAYDFEVDGIYYNILSEEEKTVEVTSGDSYTGEIIIPEEVAYEEKKYSVVSIGKSAFRASYELTSITIPNSVKTIGDYAFDYCIALNSLIFGSSVESIGVLAFGHCKSLVLITLPNTVITIKESAFDTCTSLTTINLPNSITSIGDKAFYNCSNLSYIDIPNSITKINYMTFGSCSSLTSIIIPYSVKTIGNSAFVGCRNLSSIQIPNSVKTIGGSSFAKCSSLTAIDIPNSVTSIGGAAFSGCISLSKVVIPKSVIDIGNLIFRDCPEIKSIKVEKENNKYDSREECNAIIETETNTLIVGCKNTIIPNSITTIGNSAFNQCSNLSSIIIPSTVSTIEHDAFTGCKGLSSITLPPSVKVIGDYAFFECTNLQKAISLIEAPFNISENAFQKFGEHENVFTDATLYVPVGTKELYESTPGWNLFKNIVEMGLTPVEEDSDEKDFGEDAGIDENTKMDGNIVNNIFYNILEENGFYNPEEGCIVIKKETVDDFLEYIENKNLFSDEVKQQFTGLALMLKSNCQWLKITAEASGNMMLKVKIGNMPPMEMALDGKKTVEFPCSLAEPSLAYIYGSLLPHAGAKGTHRAKAEEAEDELKIYSIAWSEEQEATGIRQTEQQAATDSPTVYNLQGQRVLPTRQGIYVVNGKKLFVK